MSHINNKYTILLEPDNDGALSWPIQEINVLFRQFCIWGTQWTKIAQIMQNRTDNSIKNKFYGMLRKTIRKINSIGKELDRKSKKNIKYESLVRVIEAPECFKNLSIDLKDKSISLRNQIIDLVRKGCSEYQKQDIQQLINGINQFNLATRSYRARRTKKNYVQNNNKTIITPNHEGQSLQMCSNQNNLNMTEPVVQNKQDQIFCQSDVTLQKYNCRLITSCQRSYLNIQQLLDTVQRKKSLQFLDLLENQNFSESPLEKESLMI